MLLPPENVETLSIEALPSKLSELDLTELEELVESMYAMIPQPTPKWMSTKEEYMTWLKEQVLPDMLGSGTGAAP